MLIQFQSPKGGKKLNWLGWGERKPETVTFRNQETGQPVILDNSESSYCLIIGYSSSDLIKGQKMYMKYNECRELYRLLKSEFES